MGATAATAVGASSTAATVGGIGAAAAGSALAGVAGTAASGTTGTLIAAAGSALAGAGGSVLLGAAGGAMVVAALAGAAGSMAAGAAGAAAADAGAGAVASVVASSVSAAVSGAAVSAVGGALGAYQEQDQEQEQEEKKENWEENEESGAGPGEHAEEKKKMKNNCNDNYSDFVSEDNSRDDPSKKAESIGVANKHHKHNVFNNIVFSDKSSAIAGVRQWMGGLGGVGAHDGTAMRSISDIRQEVLGDEDTKDAKLPERPCREESAEEKEGEEEDEGKEMDDSRHHTHHAGAVAEAQQICEDAEEDERRRWPSDRQIGGATTNSRSFLAATDAASPTKAAGTDTALGMWGTVQAATAPTAHALVESKNHSNFSKNTIEEGCTAVGCSKKGTGCGESESKNNNENEETNKKGNNVKKNKEEEEDAKEEEQEAEAVEWKVGQARGQHAIPHCLQVVQVIEAKDDSVMIVTFAPPKKHKHFEFHPDVTDV
jgi:hypothetical protein